MSWAINIPPSHPEGEIGSCVNMFLVMRFGFSIRNRNGKKFSATIVSNKKKWLNWNSNVWNLKIQRLHGHSRNDIASKWPLASVTMVVLFEWVLQFFSTSTYSIHASPSLQVSLRTNFFQSRIIASSKIKQREHGITLLVEGRRGWSHDGNANTPSSFHWYGDCWP